MRIGIFGSRKAPPAMLDDCRSYVDALLRKYPDAVIVSGGADGIDKAAEQAVLLYPHASVESFRVYQLGPEEFGIELWTLGPQASIRKLHEWPTWGDYTSGLFFRNSLIAHQSEKGACWHYLSSAGTWGTRDAFVAEDKTVWVYTEAEPFHRDA